MSEEIVKVPDIGGESDVEVIEVCVAPGDAVNVDDSLIVLESDKASMEIPSPTSGVVKSIAIEVGSKVSEGEDIMVLTTEQAVGQNQPATVEESLSSEPELSPEPVTVASGSSTLDVPVPDLGDDSEVEVIEVSVKVGDSIEADDTLIVLESDKASMEIPSPQAGVVKSLNVSEGDKVTEGKLILQLEVAGGSPAASSSLSAAPEVVSEPAPAEEPVAKSAATTSSIQTVNVPDIGDADSVEVIEVSVSEGDTVEVDDTLVVLESDKASMEIPSPYEGVVRKVLIQEGASVGEGAPIIELEAKVAAAVPASSPDAAAPAKPQASPTIQEAPKQTPQTANETKSGALVYAGPAVRMLARDLGVDLSLVTSTGPRGRLLKEDVQNFVKNALSAGPSTEASGSGIPSVPEVDFSQFGEIEVVPMTRVQKLTSAAMHRSWLNVPHVTHFDEADITDLEEFRGLKKAKAKERGLKLTPLPFLLKACAAALREYPQFNVSLSASGEELIQKQYCHIGIAMDTPAGLMVPVIRDVDKKGVWELAEEATQLGIKGQEGKLKKEDLQGGCFTISSLGAIGGQGFTPIVNTPEVAILGVSRSSVKPLYMNNEFVPRTMLPMTLSYDHRAINGVDAGKFVTYLTNVLADIRKLLM